MTPSSINTANSLLCVAEPRLELVQQSAQHLLVLYNNQGYDPYPRDEDPVLPKNRIRGSVPQTKGNFEKSIE